MIGSKNILEKVPKGHLEQNMTLAIRVIEIMWNRV
jgi:hypothetical protein